MLKETFAGHVEVKVSGPRAPEFLDQTLNPGGSSHPFKMEFLASESRRRQVSYLQSLLESLQEEKRSLKQDEIFDLLFVFEEAAQN